MEDTTRELLKGAVICCTSIPPEQRTRLAEHAEDMGALHKFDLTSDVTHLIVGDTDTPKYKFVARERLDVKCVLPGWLEALRESWLAGSDPDVVTFEDKYKLPVFYGLNICVTGFVDADERKDLDDKITANGGAYKPNLTKEENYLVAKEPTGAKYEFAEKWGIKIVSLEWVDQSIEREMVLEHSLFHPLIPAERRGAGAWMRRPISTISLGKHAREDGSGPQRSRKLRRTASARLETQNSGLWGDIAVQDVGAELAKPSAWDDGDLVDGSDGLKKEESSDGQRPMSQQCPILSDGLLGQARRGNGIFENKIFILHGFNSDQAAVAEGHLRSRGANLMDYALFASGIAKSHLDQVCVVVPHRLPATRLPAAVMDLPRSNVVTDIWIERCMHLKRLEDPSNHPACQPFPATPIIGFENLVISLTGFQGFELLHVVKPIRTLGATYEQDFSPKVSLLLCNPGNPTQEKLRHAQLWKTSAVRIDWLWDCIRNGEVMDYGPYLVQSLAPQLDDDEREDVFMKSSDTFSNSSRRESNNETSRNKPLLRSRNSDSFAEISKARRKEVNPRQRQVDPFPDNAGPSMDEAPDDHSTPIVAKTALPERSSQSLSKSQSSQPLQEITPNSSPPKAASITPDDDTVLSINAPKNASPPPSKPPSQEPALSATITSLLAAHKRTSSAKSANQTEPPTRRRRRPLLGRAPSNISHNSRASSVDTLHTDGLGTPLSSGPAIAANIANGVGTTKPGLSSFSRQESSASNVVYDNNAAEEEEQRRQQEQLMMTQLGYEDQEQRLWRERVDRKMGLGGKGDVKVTYGKSATPKKGAVGTRAAFAVGGRGQQVVGSDGGDESLGIARRTRGAVAR